MVLQPASSSLKSHSSEQKCPKGQSLAHAAKRGCHGFLLLHKASIFERRYQWHSHGGFWECTQPHYKQIYANGQDTLLRKALDFGNNILLFSAPYSMDCFPRKWDGKIFFPWDVYQFIPKEKDPWELCFGRDNLVHWQQHHSSGLRTAAATEMLLLMERLLSSFCAKLRSGFSLKVVKATLV